LSDDGDLANFADVAYERELPSAFLLAAVVRRGFVAEFVPRGVLAASFRPTYFARNRQLLLTIDEDKARENRCSARVFDMPRKDGLEATLRSTPFDGDTHWCRGNATRTQLGFRRAASAGFVLTPHADLFAFAGEECRIVLPFECVRTPLELDRRCVVDRSDATEHRSSCRILETRND
jgi:hypothetical protein